MKYIIIHGTFGHSQENRFPRLKEILEKQGHQVRIPNLPTQAQEMHDQRCQGLLAQVPFTFDKDTVLIGHSLGAVFVLDVLNRERKEPVKKAILVSGFLHKLGNEEFDMLNAPFIERERNWKQIRKNAEEFVVLHWDNDPYVPLNEAEFLHGHLWGTFEIIAKGGHLNTTAGFQTFEEVLKYV